MQWRLVVNTQYTDYSQVGKSGPPYFFTLLNGFVAKEVNSFNRVAYHQLFVVHL